MKERERITTRSHDYYDKGDVCILGFGALPENPDPPVETKPAEEVPADKIAPADTANKKPAEEKNDNDSAADRKERTITSAAGDGATVTVKGILPEDAEVTIVPVKLDEEQIALYLGSDLSLQSYVVYDITIRSKGEEWQPDDTVSVTIGKPCIEIGEDEQFAVAHVDGKGQAEEIKADMLDDGSIEITADGFFLFIIYTVDFSCGDLTFSIQGRSSILLSELFEALGIDVELGDVENVTFSDDSLIRIEKIEHEDNGCDWNIISLKAFDTVEELYITLKGGQTITICVTDARDDSSDPYIEEYPSGGAGERVYYSETSIAPRPRSRAIVRFLRDLLLDIPGYENGAITDRQELQTFRNRVNDTRPNDIPALVDIYANASRPTRNCDLYKLTTHAFLEFMGNNPTAVVHSIGFSSEITAVEIDMEGNNRTQSEVLRDIALYGKGEYQYADDAQTLAEAIYSICFMTNVVMSDTLSAYVYAVEVTELKVVQTDLSGENEVVLYINGALTASGEEILQSVAPDSATGKITVKFRPEYPVSSDYYYTASFNVRASQEAYTNYVENGYSDIGEPDTDYKNNRTSFDRPGYFSNTEGKVTWTAGGHPDEEAFNKPVIQVPGSRLYEIPQTGGERS